MQPMSTAAARCRLRRLGRADDCDKQRGGCWIVAGSPRRAGRPGMQTYVSGLRNAHPHPIRADRQPPNKHPSVPAYRLKSACGLYLRPVSYQQQSSHCSRPVNSINAHQPFTRPSIVLYITRHTTGYIRPSAARILRPRVQVKYSEYCSAAAWREANRRDSRRNATCG